MSAARNLPVWGHAEPILEDFPLTLEVSTVVDCSKRREDQARRAVLLLISEASRPVLKPFEPEMLGYFGPDFA